jgi:hypothetical protein
MVELLVLVSLIGVGYILFGPRSRPARRRRSKTTKTWNGQRRGREQEPY